MERKPILTDTGEEWEPEPRRIMRRYIFMLNLSDEDMNTAQEIANLKEMQGRSLAEVLQAVLTYGLHEIEASIDGERKPLHMDRKKPQA